MSFLKILKKIIPNRLISYSYIMGIVLIFMSITRVIFFLFNKSQFSGEEVKFYDFFVGFWFDIITLSLLFLPFTLLYLLPFRFVNHRWYLTFCRILLMLTTLLVIGLNLMDVEYYKFTNKRSTTDLLSIVTAGSDMKQLTTTFIMDFWYLILLFIVICWLIYKLIIKIEHQKDIQQQLSFKNVFFYLFTIGMLIFLGRGGFVFKPINVLDASKYTHASKTALVLNTPFTMLKSIGSEGLKEVDYFPSIEATEKYFNPIKKSNPQQILPNNSNVVFLILESFGKEFIGFYNEGKSYTPFLDSLLNESLTFTKGFANGKKSIEAVPSIFLSIPSLQDNPYISSPYNSNRVMGLPELLKKYGYETAFYHGATNGSMRFDSFAKFIGFDHYIGKNEYNNEKHSDQTWGILDEYFNPWTAKQISKLKEPFLASLFTLSSHHPYYIPPHREKEVLKGDQPICASINYGDISLRLFFEEAKKQPWYNNTLFVICADHTPSTLTYFYTYRTQIYQIPIAFYHPQGKLPKEQQDKIVQQLDLYPTILDLLNINTKFYSYGQSIFDTTRRYSISYLQGNYYYFEDDKMLVFNQNKAQNLHNFTAKDNVMLDLLLENKNKVTLYESNVKAIIQRYNHDLIRNKTKIVK